MDLGGWGLKNIHYVAKALVEKIHIEDHWR